MTVEAWLLFVATETLLCLHPGPAVLLVISQGLAGGTRRALWSSGGVLSANALYFALSATSLGAILVVSWEAFFLIKWVGAAYLILLGIRAWRASATLEPDAPDHAASTTPEASGTSGTRTLAHGFVTQAANPKTLLFFGALLPQFVEPTEPVAFQIAILGATSIAIELAVLAGYGALAARTARLAARPRFRRIVARASGGLLIGAGVGLASLRRT